MKRKDFFKRFKDLKVPEIETIETELTLDFPAKLGDYSFDQKGIYYKDEPFFFPSKKAMQDRSFKVMGRYLEIPGTGVIML